MNIVFSQAQTDMFNRNLAELDSVIARGEGDDNYISALYNKSLTLLAAGRFKEAWPLFTARFNVPDIKFSTKHFPLDIWDGESISGKHVFLWFEQGIGDQIMIASMLDELTDAVGDGSVTLLCDRVLVDIMRRSFPRVEVYKVGEPPSERLEMWDFDCQLCFSDLGRMFRPSFESFPGKPYLKPDPAKVAFFRERYAEAGKTLVGIAWSSSSKATGLDKSLNLVEMKSVINMQVCKYVDMQYGDHYTELRLADEGGLSILHDSIVDQLIDMDTFCAQVAAMDMVISSSNTLAHVAGALGVETHTIIPLGKGRLWYWFGETKKSPWYGSMTLWRQEVPGRWELPVMNLRFHLEETLRERAAPCQISA